MDEFKYPFGTYKQNMDKWLATMPDDKMFFARLRPDDCVCGCFKKTFYKRLNEEMPEYFLMSCQGFKKAENSSTYEPIFCRIQQAAWNAAYSEMLKEKGEWIARFGSE